jgi:hypothetical protein
MIKPILSLCFCLFVMAAHGQSDDKGRFDLPNGFRLGYQQSNLFNNDVDAADNLHRGYVGYIRKIGRARMLHLETGLEYMIAGAQVSEEDKLQLHYLSLPAQGVLKLGPFVGVAGLNANFMIADNFDSDNNAPEPDLKRFDLVADAGVGFNILFMTLEARYYWGLLEVTDGWYNRYWQAGLKFHF